MPPLPDGFGDKDSSFRSNYTPARYRINTVHKKPGGRYAQTPAQACRQQNVPDIGIAQARRGCFDASVSRCMATALYSVPFIRKKEIPDIPVLDAVSAHIIVIQRDYIFGVIIADAVICAKLALNRILSA